MREVGVYCKTCGEMICTRCGIIEPHGRHEKFDAEQILEKEQIEGEDEVYKSRIIRHEKKVEGVHGNFSLFICEMKELQTRLKEHQTTARTEIESRLKEIQTQLEKDKETLAAKVDQIFEAKSKRLEDQIEELQRIEAILNDSRERITNTLAMGIPSEILFNMKYFIKRSESLFDQYDTYDRTPRENDILQFSPNVEFDLSGAIGTVAADPFPEAFTLDGLDSIHFIQGKEAPLIVTCRDIAGTPRPIKHDIKVELCPPGNGEALQGTVERDVDKGTYRVKLQPNSQGDHELKVSVVVGNEEKCVPITGSPFKVRVSRPLLGGIEAENIAIAGLQNPWGVAVWHGAKPEGREGEDGEPGGAGGGAGSEGAGVRNDDGAGGQDDAAGAGNAENGEVVAITDIGTHRLLIVTNNDFQNPRWIGKEGGGEGDGNSEFNSPRGVAFNQNGEIVVVDKDNCRVQVISAEGDFKSKFGTRGSENGEFRRPTDVVH
ncbi:E3 ubiquitin-protein ligase TRIM71 [Geodia barretti]|uniref:E3 ubiquitin-protein ligase TRIM71 n=1 Tax=Geodia barretti TaxID=519541 RepID=A0AA35WKR6_GEOBA|nr:E3 ubiquitin-protein ligase TRIM71 [Geodia barretti]